MRLLIPLLAGILTLSSCVSRGNKAAKTAPAPVTPTPAAAKPSAPPPPVSTPQTQVQLPPPQAVSPAALATIPPAREEQPAPEPSQGSKPAVMRKQGSGNVATITSTAETPAPAPPQGPAAPLTPPAEEQPRLQPVYTEEERRRVSAELERRKGEIEGLLRGVNQNNMSADRKSVVQRINSFMSQAEDHARRGDLRSAEALSERAVIFARELASGR